jgi:hypothetical protein
MLKKESEHKTQPHIIWLYDRYKEKLEEYVELLEYEKDAIRTGKADKLDEYARLDESIANTIGSIRTCIIAWRKDHETKAEYQSEADRLDEITAGLLGKAKDMISQNRGLCEAKMKGITSDIESVQSKMTKCSPYGKLAEPRIIDIMQ